MKYLQTDTNITPGPAAEVFFPAGVRPLSFRLFDDDSPTCSAIVHIYTRHSSQNRSYSVYFSSIRNGSKVRITDVTAALPTNVAAIPASDGDYAVSVEARGAGSEAVLSLEFAR